MKLGNTYNMRNRKHLELRIKVLNKQIKATSDSNEIKFLFKILDNLTEKLKYSR